MRLLQAHIAQRGAIPPLIEMLQSSDTQLKEMSAFALGRLAQVFILYYYYYLYVYNGSGRRYLQFMSVKFYLNVLGN